jgi:hypothetical protein
VLVFGGLTRQEAEKLRSAPRWRINRPLEELGPPPPRTPSARHLASRVLTISHVHELGNQLARAIGAQEPYVLTLDRSQRVATWTDLRTVIPEELELISLSATGHLLDHSENGPQGTQWQQATIRLSAKAPAMVHVSGTPQGPEDQARYVRIADELSLYYENLGDRRPDRSSLIPVLFWMGVAAVVLPLVWLLVTGRLSWMTAPFLAAASFAAVAYLSEQVGRWSDRRRAGGRSAVVNVRPVDEVRRDAEAHRQKVRIAWITAAVTGPITAVLGAVLAQVLR